MSADASRQMYSMIQLSNEHPAMLCGMQKNAEHAQLTSIFKDGKADFETGFMIKVGLKSLQRQ